MNNIEKMILAFSSRTLRDAVNAFVVEQNDDITNQVRKYLDNLSEEEIVEVQEFLNRLLNYCYDGRIYPDSLDESEYNIIKELTDEEKFLFKENVIYFIGRLPIQCDINALKKAYQLDDNKYIKLNIAFASLQSFDEEIELDFVDKVFSDSEYDEIIRSWTMAFFKQVDKPYEYKDSKDDDWTVAKLPRIRRLSINDTSNPKYKKAMSFRLLDLVVLSLLIKNRGENTLSQDERKIVEEADTNYKLYSKEKKNKMNELKEKILSKYR